MADKIKEAKQLYNQVIKTLDKLEAEYKTNADDFTIGLVVGTEDLPVSVAIKVDADRQFLAMYSHMPFTVKRDPETQLNMALAICDINDKSWFGVFDYDIKSGEILLRMISHYSDSILSPEVIRRMLLIAIQDANKYNDRLYLLNEGKISVEQVTED